MTKQRTAGVRGRELQVNNLLPPNPGRSQRRGQTERDIDEATRYYRTSRGETTNGATSMLYSHSGPALG